MMPITYKLKKTGLAPASVYNSGHTTVKKNNRFIYTCMYNYVKFPTGCTNK